MFESNLYHLCTLFVSFASLFFIIFVSYLCHIFMIFFIYVPFLSHICIELLSYLHSHQCPTRALFQRSRRDREYLSFNLVSETGSRISFFQSHASRRDREFLFFSISCLETRSRISFFQSRALRGAREFVHLISGFETRVRNSVISS